MNTMRIFKGSHELTEVFQGIKEITEIYYGNAVWRKAIVEEKPNVRGFPISDLTPTLRKLTASLAASSKVPIVVDMTEILPVIDSTTTAIIDMHETLSIDTQEPISITFEDIVAPISVYDITNVKKVVADVNIDILDVT